MSEIVAKYKNKVIKYDKNMCYVSYDSNAFDLWINPKYKNNNIYRHNRLNNFIEAIAYIDETINGSIIIYVNNLDELVYNIANSYVVDMVSSNLKYIKEL